MFQSQATNVADLRPEANSELERDSGKIKDAVKVVDPAVQTKRQEVSLDNATLTKTEVKGVSITEKAEIVKGAVHAELLRRGLSEELAVGYAQLAAVYAIAEEGRSQDQYAPKNLRKNAGLEEDIDPVTEEMDQAFGLYEELERLDKNEHAGKLEELGIDQEVIEKIELARADELEDLKEEICEISPEMTEPEIIEALNQEADQGVSLEAAIQYASTVNEYIEKLPVAEQHNLVDAGAEDVQTLVNDYKENTEEKLLEREINIQSGTQEFSQAELLEVGQELGQDAEYIQTEMPEIAPKVEVERGVENKLEQSREAPLDLDHDPRQDLLDAMAVGLEEAPESELFTPEFNPASAEDYQQLMNPLNPFSRMRLGVK